MIQLGRYTFESEAHRAADYRRRVGPLRIPRTNTVEVLNREGLGPWLFWLRRHSAERYAARIR